MRAARMAPILPYLKAVFSPSMISPNLSIVDISWIDFKALKDVGVNYVGLDKDNTITRPGEKVVERSLVEKFEECKKTFPGRVILVSNSRRLPDGYDKELGIAVFEPKELKPSGGGELVKWIKERDGLGPDEPVKLAFFGDRILTDVLYANKNNFVSFLTARVLATSGESKTVTRLRNIERWLLKRLEALGIKRNLPAYLTVHTNSELRDAVLSKCEEKGQKVRKYKILKKKRAQPFSYRRGEGVVRIQ